MSTIAPAPHTTARPDHGPAWLTRWSLLMLPITAVSWFLAGILGYLMLGPLGLHEGDLPLMQRGVAGWTAEIAFDLVVAVPAVVGAWFAVRALRRGGHWGAWVGLVLNAALVAVMVYTFVDAVHMTYFPGARWLWF